MKKIIDTEIRLIHPQARNKNFCKDSGEINVQKTIYDHKKINLSLKQASLENFLNVMRQNKINKAIISGLPWKKIKNLNLNNQYLLMCAKKYPEKFKVFYNIDFSHYNSFNYSMNLINFSNNSRILGFELNHNSFFLMNKKKNIYLKKLIKNIIKKKKFVRFIGRHALQHNINHTFYYNDIIKKYKYNKFFITSFGGGIANYLNIKNIKEIYRNVLMNTSASKNLDFTYKIGSILPKNLVFGTDYPFNHFNQYDDFLKVFKKLRLTKKLENIIKYKNAQKKFF